MNFKSKKDKVFQWLDRNAVGIIMAVWLGVLLYMLWDTAH